MEKIIALGKYLKELNKDEYTITFEKVRKVL